MVKGSFETKIAVMATDIGYIKDSMSEIKGSIKGLPLLFASKEELKDVTKETEIRLSVLEKKSEGLGRFMIPVFTAVGSSIMTFLIIQYLEKLRQI